VTEEDTILRASVVHALMLSHALAVGACGMTFTTGSHFRHWRTRLRSTRTAASRTDCNRVERHQHLTEFAFSGQLHPQFWSAVGFSSVITRIVSVLNQRSGAERHEPWQAAPGCGPQ
jgi:hypothetical protein